MGTPATNFKFMSIMYNIEENKLTGRGIRKMLTSKFERLHSINLSKNRLIQMRIKFKMRDLNA